MAPSKLRIAILALNLQSLLAYGLTMLTTLPPFQDSVQASFFGYGHVWALMIGLGTGSALAFAGGVLTVIHLTRARRWSWDLLLTGVTCFVAPALVVLSFFL
ncbi:MAG: hypothetical protein MUF64_08110 [Polyangiaceae bacterium]|jgi:hypothetical protein|nr:hypothetical protein [Polyangiaceae bacterium]